jgi:hypothetical protein
MQARLTTKPEHEVIAAIQALDLESVKSRVMDAELGEGWSREYADSIETAYRTYLTMLVKYPEDADDILLSQDVDEFWHTHILQTRKYSEDCQKAFGNYLHHEPHVGEVTPADHEKRTALAEKTRRLYEQEFGNARAGAAWAGAAIQSGNAAFSNAAIRETGAAFSNASVGPERAAVSNASIRADAAFSNAAIAAGKAAFSNAAIQAQGAAFSNAAIQAKNAAFSNAAIDARNAAFSNAAIRAGNAAFSNAAIKAGDAAFSNAAIEPRKAAFSNASIQGKNAAFSNASVRK